jgi:hypothetical protein
VLSKFDNFREATNVMELAAVTKYLKEHAIEWEEPALERLATRRMAAVRTIMAGNDVQWEGHSFDAVFGDFKRQVPGWESTDAVLFFNNEAYQNHPFLKSLRHQTTGNCGAHAAVQLLHYLMDIRSAGNVNVGSVDLTAYMQLSELRGEDLLNYLTRKRHIKPLFYFASLGRLDHTNFIRLSFQLPFEGHLSANLLVAAEIMDQVTTQPGMVTDFVATQPFTRSTLASFAGKPTFAGTEGVHTMLIVGARHVGDAYYFLLQNWYNEKQFVEVSAEYLAYCLASMFFVPTTQSITMSPTVPVKLYSATECTIEDESSEDEECENE